MNGIAKGFGMETFAHDPFIHPARITELGATPVAKLEDLFKHQYVSLHVPLTHQTMERRARQKGMLRIDVRSRESVYSAQHNKTNAMAMTGTAEKAPEQFRKLSRCYKKSTVIRGGLQT